jgi:hypothetical protein
MEDRNTPEPSDDTSALSQLRRQRMNDHLRAALSDSDPLLANVGAVNSDLMAMALRIRDLTEEAFAESHVNLTALVPTFDIGLRVARQIQPFAELEHRVRAR